MRKPEQWLWDALRSHAAKDQSVYFERIENVVGDGMPDVVALADGPLSVTSFVELKARTTWPVRKDTPVFTDDTGMRVSQINWHLNWTRRGGNSYVLIGVGVLRQRQLFLLSGALAPGINRMTKHEFQLIEPDSWATIFTRLQRNQ